MCCRLGGVLLDDFYVVGRKRRLICNILCAAFEGRAKNKWGGEGYVEERHKR